MQFELRRIILFTANLEAMASFYQNVLGLKLVHSEKGWRELAAGGCTIIMDISDQFWGDRYGQLRDPFGHRWSIGSPLKG